MKIIYADILIVINLAVDYLLLFGTARLYGANFSRLKGLFAAAVGAIYSLIIFFDFSASVVAFTKLFFSGFMILIAFGKRKPKEFLKLLLFFYFCGFIFSGFMVLLNSVVKEESFFNESGIIYFEFSAMEIVFSGTAAFLITEIFQRFFKSREQEETAVVKIFYLGKYAVLKVFTDTGNNLAEPFSGMPVAVAPPEALEKILPEKMLSAAKKQILSTEFPFRFIPCKTISGTVLIPAFKPEKVILENRLGVFEVEEIMVAISDNAPENTLIVGKNIVLKEKDKIFSEVR